jgi:hypothetical protein
MPTPDTTHLGGHRKGKNDMPENAYERLAKLKTRERTVNFEGEPAGSVEDEVSVLNGDGDYKFFLQRIRLSPKKGREMGSKRAYRWCYWTVTGKGDRLAFGQYALFLSETALRNLLSKARKKGWPV